LLPILPTAAFDSRYLYLETTAPIDEYTIMMSMTALMQLLMKVSVLKVRNIGKDVNDGFNATANGIISLKSTLINFIKLSRAIIDHLARNLTVNNSDKQFNKSSLHT
jgi:hypothetical protein